MYYTVFILIILFIQDNIINYYDAMWNNYWLNTHSMRKDGDINELNVNRVWPGEVWAFSSALICLLKREFESKTAPLLLCFKRGASWKSCLRDSDSFVLATSYPWGSMTLGTVDPRAADSSNNKPVPYYLEQTHISNCSTCAFIQAHFDEVFQYTLTLE